MIKSVKTLRMKILKSWMNVENRKENKKGNMQLEQEYSGGYGSV